MNLWRFPCSIKASSVGLRVSAKAKAFSCLTLISLFKLGLTTQHQQDVETVTIGLQTFYVDGFIEAEFADDPSGETLGNPDYEEAQEESRYAWESVWPFFLP